MKRSVEVLFLTFTGTFVSALSKPFFTFTLVASLYVCADGIFHAWTSVLTAFIYVCKCRWEILKIRLVWFLFFKMRSRSRSGSRGRVQGVRTPPLRWPAFFVFAIKICLRPITSQLRHSLVVHPLLKKVLDPPLMSISSLDFKTKLFILMNSSNIPYPQTNIFGGTLSLKAPPPSGSLKYPNPGDDGENRFHLNARSKSVV